MFATPTAVKAQVFAASCGEVPDVRAKSGTVLMAEMPVPGRKLYSRDC